MPKMNETDPLDETTQMENDKGIVGESPVKVPQTPVQEPEKQAEEEKKDCNTIAHVVAKTLGKQHGCEVDPNAPGEEEKKDN